MEEEKIINYGVNGSRKRRLTIPGRRFVWFKEHRLDIQSARDMARRDFVRDGSHNMQFVNMFKSLFKFLWVKLPIMSGPMSEYLRFAAIERISGLVSEFVIFEGDDDVAWCFPGNMHG